MVGWLQNAGTQLAPRVWVWETLHLLQGNAQVGLSCEENQKNLNGVGHLTPSISEAEKGGQGTLVYTEKN